MKSSMMSGSLVWLALIATVAGNVDLANNELQLENLLQEGHKQIDLKGCTDLIMLVGPSGSGKSTLANFLTNNTALKTLMNNSGRLIYSDNEKTIGTQSQTSKTNVPNVILDTQSGKCFVDCPGFVDTRKDPAFDIAAAFFLKLVFNSAKNIKILFVTPHEDLIHNTNRKGFVESMTHLTTLIPNCNPFAGSIGIIATKVKDDEYYDSEIESFIKSYVNTTILGHLIPEKAKIHGKAELKTIEDQIDKDIILGNILNEANNKIGIFRYPCRAQSRICIHTDYNRLRQVIFESLSFVPSDPAYYSISVSDESKIFIGNTLLPKAEQASREKNHIFIEKALSTIKNKIDPGNVDKTVQILIQEEANFKLLFNNFNVHSELSSNFRAKNQWSNVYVKELHDLSIKLKLIDFFNKATLKNSVPLLVDLQRHRESKIIDLIVELRVQVQFKSFCTAYNLKPNKQVKISESTPVPSVLKTLGFPDKEVKFVEQLSPGPQFKQNLQKLYHPCLEMRQEQQQYGRILVAQGRNVKLSSVNDNSGQTQVIFLIASGKITLDRDLSVTHSHLVLIAPEVEVVGQRTITLTGENAQEYSAAGGVAHMGGSNGSPGQPGYSSGSIMIHAKRTINAGKLKIDTKGGNGGNGQQGGSGKPGKSAKLDWDIYTLVNCVLRTRERTAFTNHGYDCANGINSPTKIDDTHYHTDQFLNLWLTTKNSESSTAGGRGGDAGHGAKAGEVRIDVSDTGKFELNAVDGRNGAAGSGGASPTVCIKYENKVGCNHKIVGGRLFDCSELWSKCGAHTNLPQGAAGTSLTDYPPLLKYKHPRLSAAEARNVYDKFVQHLGLTAEVSEVSSVFNRAVF